MDPIVRKLIERKARKELKLGDVVYEMSSNLLGPSYSIRRVTRLTPTTILLSNGERLHKESGKQMGRRSSGNTYYVPESVPHARAEVRQIERLIESRVKLWEVIYAVRDLSYRVIDSQDVKDHEDFKQQLQAFLDRFPQQ